jgi:hypothetical protein
MEYRLYFTATSFLFCVLFSFTVSAKNDITKTSYTRNAQVKEEGPIDIKRAKKLVQEYYNAHSMWARLYEMKSVKRIRFEHHGPRRVTAHVEYSYQPIDSEKLAKGVDKRVFLLIKKRAWRVISMGAHGSARFR